MARSCFVYALITLALLASSAGWTAPDPAEGWVQWSDGDFHNNHWYKAFLWTDAPEQYKSTAGITWQNAQDYAVSIGGYLATVTSFEESMFVFEPINSAALWQLGDDPYTGTNLGPWLGGFQNTAGGWEWVTGEPWDWTNWDDGEPNNIIAGEDYLSFIGRGELTDRWNDLRGDWEMKGFVVEYQEPVPEPSSILTLSAGLFGLLGMIRRKNG